MNYEQLIKENNYLNLAKEAVGIVRTSTAVDNTLKTHTRSALEDLSRVDIDVKSHAQDNLLKTTLMLYVKGQYGDTDINKRNEYMKRYTQNLRSMQRSVEYLKKEESD